jgi:poly(A) polymerase
VIRKLLDRVFSRSDAKAKRAGAASAAAARRAGPEVFGQDRHAITPDRLSHCARRTCEGLQKAGYQGFVVGGAVRDLLLGRDPKDYDVATDATPEQVHAVFRRSRIIGRRFRLVHVLCGNDVVEVSTFRAAQGDGDGGDDQKKDAHGRLLRDNVFGSQEEDAIRRDFTVNALYYDPSRSEVLDWCGGMRDLDARVLRMIGDPEERYREDPVRMLRAVRLAAKLGLEIEPATRAPIARMAPLLDHVPRSRLFEETLKLLLSGHAVACVERLRREGLQGGLLPLLDVILAHPVGERFVTLALESTDARIRDDKGVSPGFLFAALLWHEVLATWRARQAQGLAPVPAMHEAMDEVLTVQAEKLSVPRRYGADMKEIWLLQWRFEQRSGRRPWRVLESEKFRAGYDFLLLRCESGEVDAELGEWWTEFQDADETRREALLQPADAANPKKRRRRRRGPRASTDTGSTDADAEAGSDGSAAAASAPDTGDPA